MAGQATLAWTWRDGDIVNGVRVGAPISYAGDYVISHRSGQHTLSYRPPGEHHPLGSFKSPGAAKRAARKHATSRADLRNLMRHTHSLPLTPVQKDNVEWALDAMACYVTEEDCDYAEAELPVVEKTTLHFTPGSAFDDLVWRLKHQLPDVIGDNSDWTLATRGRVITALEKFVEKLGNGGGGVMKLEVHTHRYVSGPHTGQIEHAHEDGNQQHAHPHTGPACYTIDKDEWARATGFAGWWSKEVQGEAVGTAVGVTSREAVIMKPEEKSNLLASAAAWDQLADDDASMAAWNRGRGLDLSAPGQSAGDHRARTYRRAAESLRREAETGKCHCTNCGGMHANHECPGVKCSCGICVWCKE